MSPGWVDELLEPVSAEQPCGQSLDGTPVLGVLEGFRVWGRLNWDEPGKDGKDVPRPPDWRNLEKQALEALRIGKDLRALAWLGAAAVHNSGLPGLTGALHVAAEWLDQHWEGVFPALDEDPKYRCNYRCNAVVWFTDRLAVLDGVREAPLVSHPQLGRFSLRELEASGDSAAPRAAFAATPLEELERTRQVGRDASASLARIDARLREEAGIEDAPDLEPLVAQLKRVDAALREQLKAHPDAKADDVDPEVREQTGTSTSGARAVGAVNSRQDAIRALDAVASFFKQTEPSSPVPLLVERAKRLVSKNFLEVLADIAPGGLGEARSAGGVKEES